MNRWLCLLAVWACSGFATAQVQRPNVLLIISDGLRYESCGFADDEKAVTPHIDHLARSGISFDNYVTNSPVSASGQATLWTGTYASSHGVLADAMPVKSGHEQVGRLLQNPDDCQLNTRTIVVFTSNHGEQLGAHARLGADTFFDKSVHVPLLIRWPGRIPSGRRSNACISTVDVMPTICGMLGVGFPDSTDGIDLSDSTRVDCSCEPDFAFLQGMGHDSDWTDRSEWRAVRDQRFTYARRRVGGQEWLFDNRSDPAQSRNLIDEPSFAADRQRLRQWLAEKQLALHDE